MGKAYFGPEFVQFLQQIKRNNRRPWFLKNRERYEEVVRKPGLRFVVDFGFRLKEISPWIVVDAKPHGGSLQRIYRDVRFSADKRPYKTSVGMVFPHASRTEEVRADAFGVRRHGLSRDRPAVVGDRGHHSTPVVGARLAAHQTLPFEATNLTGQPAR